MAVITKWTNVSVSIQSALATAVAITAITKANPGVVTATAHGLANGEYVYVTAQGMSQIDGRVFRAANVTANTYELEGENTTTYTTFSSGTSEEITFGTSLTTATGVTASGGDPNFIDVTTIHDNVQKQISGNASASSFSFDSIWDPADAGLIALKAASDAGTQRAMMLAFSNGRRVLFNGDISATLLPTGNAGEAVKTPVAITMFGRPTVYST